MFGKLGQIAKRHAALVTACAVLGTGGAWFVTGILPEEYAASTRLFVSVSGRPEGLSEAYQGALYTRQKVHSYADLAVSRAVTRPVAAELSRQYAPVSGDEVADRVTVTTPLNSEIMTITTRDQRPTVAAAMANGLAKELRAQVGTLEKGVTNVRISTVDPAVPDDQPVFPLPAVNLAAGLMLGLAAGMGLAMLRQRFDTRLSDGHSLSETAGAPLLGEVTRDGKAAGDPWSLANDASPAYGESFRKLRVNLQYVNVDNPPKVIVVTSAVPGEGKTVVATHLAVALAQAGSRVALVDADLRRPRVADHLGIVSEVGLTNLVTGQVELDDVVQVVGKENPITVVAAGAIPPNPSELLGSGQMRDLVAQLRESFDYVVVDTPPLLPVVDASVLAVEADGAVLVADGTDCRRADVLESIRSLAGTGAVLLGVVANKVKQPGKRKSGYYYRAGTRPGRASAVRSDERAVPALSVSHPAGEIHDRPVSAFGYRPPAVENAQASVGGYLAHGDTGLDFRETAFGRPGFGTADPTAPRPSAEQRLEELMALLQPTIGGPWTHDQIRGFLLALVSGRGEAAFHDERTRWLLYGTSWDADEIRDVLSANLVGRLADPDAALTLLTGDIGPDGVRGGAVTSGNGVFLSYALPEGGALIDRDRWQVPAPRGASGGGPDVMATVERAVQADVPFGLVVCDDPGLTAQLAAPLKEQGIGYALRTPTRGPGAGEDSASDVERATADLPASAWTSVRQTSSAEAREWALAETAEGPLLLNRGLNRGTVRGYRCHNPGDLPLGSLAKAASLARPARRSLEDAVHRIGLNRGQSFDQAAWYRYVTLCMVAHACTQDLARSEDLAQKALHGTSRLG